MPKRASLSTLDVCTPVLLRLAAILAVVFAATPAAAQVTSFGGPFKIGFYNIQSGKGEPGLPGRPTPFADTSNCTDLTQPLNAWGIGFVQQELVAKIGNDPSVIALGLAEAWTSVCASPERVRQALGWRARSESRNGLGLVARHGFASAVTFLQLDTSQSTNLEPRYIAHARVCVDSGCTASFDVFVTHMAATGTYASDSMVTQVRQAVGFMAQYAGGRPHALLGDFNVYEETGPACGSSPWPRRILDELRNTGYVDAWRVLKGSTPGYTGMTNRPGCGSPEGGTYKRIDYAWSRGVTPASVSLFGVVPVGDPAPSDHYGLLAEYSSGTAPPPMETTGPELALTAPASGAIVSGTTTLAATAADASGVARVEFFANDVLVGTDTGEPYTASWDTRTLPNGSYGVQARAVDTLGNASTTPLRTVHVSNVVSAPSPGPAGGDVVIHASQAAITGSLWGIADDATAASGRLLFNANLAAARPSTASASPSDYAELTFHAEQGRGYRLWVRGKAASNNWANDSMFVQFSGSVDAAGAPMWRIGTTGSTIVQIEEGVNAGLSGWGWSDNGYDSLGPLVYFETTGPQTLRLQIREDGLSIDQIVLSASTYLTASPGATKNDTTILEVTAPPATGVVTSYRAVVDRVARPKPPLPAIGGAGFRFADPTFGSRLLRVTDGRTRPNVADRSFKTPSASHQNAWNTTSRYFYVLASGGNVVPFAFDAATMTASRIEPLDNADGGLMLDFFGEPQFSYVAENLIYGARKSALRTIQQYDFASGTYTLLLDLQTLGADLSGTYVGGVMSSGGPVEKVLAWYGGTGQDRHHRVVVFERENPSRRRLLDTLASTIDGVPSATLLNFKLHHVELDRSGRYVLLSPTTPDRQAPRHAAVEYVWDLQTDVITPLDEVADVAGGHKALGYGQMLNKGCCTSSAWDAAQWQIRSLAAPTVTRDLIAPLLQPKEIYLSDHASWNNANASRLVPFVSATYRYGNNTAEWRAWDDEIVAVKTEPGETTVWRFAHHRSNVGGDPDPTRPYFWYMPRLNVSQDGRWAIFTSNWEKTLGVDPVVTSTVEYRQDVFLVELLPGTAPAPAPNQAPSVSITRPAAGSVLSAGSVTVAADASDPDGSVTRVDFFANGAPLGSDATAPFTASWAAARGSYTLTAIAFDNAGASTVSAVASVTVVDPVTITTSALANAVQGRTYLQSLAATGGLGSFTWSVTGGSLPAGIALSSSGTLSGTPTAAGSWGVTLQAADAADPSRSAARAFTLTVEVPPNVPPVVSVASPVSGSVLTAGTLVAIVATASDSDGSVARVDLRVNGTVIATDTTAPYSAGWLVPAAGDYLLSATAVDNTGAAATSASVPVRAVAPVQIVTTTLPAVHVGRSYAESLRATGGLGSYSWSLASGSLPPGLTLASDGAIAGRPTAAGSYTFTALVRDAADASRSASRTLTIAVTAREVVIYAADAAGVVGAWELVADATSPAGVRLWNPNKTAGRNSSPQAAPASYIEFRFQAEAGRPYRLWIRGKGEKNNWANDSAFVQFSGAVDGQGVPQFRIGTTDAAIYQVEEGVNAGLSNWGWQDHSYGELADPIYFATTGTQTIRLQPREDGISIDQVVISAGTYFDVRPGLTKNDATIVAK